ncbi:MAG: XdhC family protein [Thermoleophilaceae bacterium]|nr:XdhC family protein [Thermoleophilaceae bacterium]
MSLQGAFAELVRADGRGSLVTVVGLESPGEGAGTAVAPGAKLLIRADGRAEGTLGDARLDRAATEHAEELMWTERSELRDGPGGVRLFVDVVAPPPRFVIFGAVDFAPDLCGMARATGWRPYVVDPRTRFASPERFPDAEEIVAAWPAEAFAQLGGIDRATYIAVLTHDPKLDDAALTLALASDAAYIGAMGSRRAQEARRERLLAAGVPEHQLARIAAPIGLDLGGLTGAETALSIMAEVVAVRSGHEGGRLSHARGRIHEVGA